MIAMRWKRLFYYLLLNMIVTACTMVVVLYAWEKYRPQVDESPLDVLFPSFEEAAAPEISPTEVPIEDLAFLTHTVQIGESLSVIAADYGTTVDEILRFNEIADPDELLVGMVLDIPVPGAEAPVAQEAIPTQTPPPQPTLAVTAPPANAEAADLQIALVIGAGDLAEERVIVRQKGDAEVSLQGWQLLSPNGDRFTFPQLVLFKDGAVTVFTRAGGNSVAELYWNLDAPIWQTGDVVSLLDPAGNIVAAYQVP